MALIALPALILHAQSEEATGVERAAESIVTEGMIIPAVEEEAVAHEVAAGVAIEEAATTNEGNPVVEGADDKIAEEAVAAGPTAEESAAIDTSEEGGQEASAVIDTGAEAAEETVTEAATVLLGEPVADALASSTASSTPPADPPLEAEEDPYVLQPAVDFTIGEDGLKAQVTLENLSCRKCDKTFPAVPAQVYYTDWYSNDGPDSKEVGAHLGEKTVNTSEIAPWRAETISWSAERPASGHYYFVVVMDPENANDAYRLFRSEFSL